MSWSIYATGSVEKVKQKVVAAKQTFHDPVEQEEFDAAKQLIVKRLDGFKLDPDKDQWASNAVKLEASGSSHGTGQGASLRIELQGVRLDI